MLLVQVALALSSNAIGALLPAFPALQFRRFLLLFKYRLPFCAIDTQELNSFVCSFAIALNCPLHLRIPVGHNRCEYSLISLSDLLYFARMFLSELNFTIALHFSVNLCQSQLTFYSALCQTNVDLTYLDLSDGKTAELAAHVRLASDHVDLLRVSRRQHSQIPVTSFAQQRIDHP